MLQFMETLFVKLLSRTPANGSNEQYSTYQLYPWSPNNGPAIWVHGRHSIIFSGTKTEFCVPDHGSRTVIMAKFRAFMQNPDLFRTTFLTFPDF